tara:strand:- start:367 stop:561 length:195 start_codon:yes stop_codon:yes gene_type:complete
MFENVLFKLSQEFFVSARRVIFLTLIAMIDFAGNSLLCRAALLNTAIDAASFTTIRLFSGALML